MSQTTERVLLAVVALAMAMCVLPLVVLANLMAMACDDALALAVRALRAAEAAAGLRT